MIRILIGFLLIGAGLVLALWDRRASARRRGFSHWDVVGGRVTASRVVDAGDTLTPRSGAIHTLWTAEVTYTYEVEGVPHEGRQTRFHGLDAGDFDHAERVVASLKPGAPVDVAYDPENPATSTLATDPPNRVLFGLGLVLVAVGGLVMMSV